MGTPPRREPGLVDPSALVRRVRRGGQPDGVAAAPVERLGSKRLRTAAIRAAREYLAGVLSGDAAASLVDVVREDGRPGWDLEYRDARGDRIAVLVRGSGAATFSSVEVSSVEWSSAKRLGVRYWLVLVADVDGAPRIAAIQNPAGQVQDRTIDAHPTGWRLTWPVLDLD